MTHDVDERRPGTAAAASGAPCRRRLRRRHRQTDNVFAVVVVVVVVVLQLLLLPPCAAKQGNMSLLSPYMRAHAFHVDLCYAKTPVCSICCGLVVQLAVQIDQSAHHFDESVTGPQ